MTQAKYIYDSKDHSSSDRSIYVGALQQVLRCHSVRRNCRRFKLTHYEIVAAAIRRHCGALLRFGAGLLLADVLRTAVTSFTAAPCFFSNNPVIVPERLAFCS
jgi:hypothetical protein